MKEKMFPVSKEYHQRRKKRRRRHFLGGCMFTIFLAVSVCVYAFLWFEHGQAVALDESTPANVQTTADDTHWNLMLVNYENAVPENYETKLMEVPGGEKVDERIYEPLMEMLEAAKDRNWDQLPVVVSGYRTQEKQQQIFDDKVAEYQSEGNSQKEAEELAKQWVSLPGYSEHQIGLAVDINGSTYDLYFWLQENSYKYGFVFRYPGNKTEYTGVAEEVWHYRYVGVEAATEMYERGICLEEYLAEREEEEKVGTIPCSTSMQISL